MDKVGVFSSLAFGILAALFAVAYSGSLYLGLAVFFGLGSITSIIDIGFRALLKQQERDIRSQFIDKH